MSISEGDPQSPSVETLASVGEVAVLNRIFPRLPVAAAELLGPGDDAAVVRAPDGRFVVTTDLMVHGPDFRLAWSTPHDLGWKAAASNLADVVAMGARPTALVVALAAPLDTPVTVLEGIADGLKDACEELFFGVGVVGGDLSASRTLTLSVTAFGDLEGRLPLTRRGARPGDRITVAGDLGRSAAGIWLLYTQGVDLAGDHQPDRPRGLLLRDSHPELIEAQLAPKPPLSAGIAAALAGATAMLDVSDGLALDAGRIALASGCSLDFAPDAIASEASALLALDTVVGDRAADFVLSGGEDHAFLATFPAGVQLPADFRVIGTVTKRAAGHPFVTVGGKAYSGGGWDPFNGWNGSVG